MIYIFILIYILLYRERSIKGILTVTWIISSFKLFEFLISVVSFDTERHCVKQNNRI